MSEALGPGEAFIRATAYSRSRTGLRPPPVPPAPPFKRYPQALRRVSLPRAEHTDGPGLWEALHRRRSRRDFLPQPLTAGQLSQLLWAVAGITGEVEGVLLRAAASAGGLYPVETYLFVHQVEGCPPGLAHYDVQAHALEVLAEGDYRHALTAACLGQEFCRSAAVVLCWTAVMDRALWRYADRAYRYALLDAGHLGAHLQLAATALGLGSVNVGAFYDEEINQLLNLGGEQELAIYLAAVGQLAPAGAG